MAGHSQFANIKHRKAAQDAKKSKKFTKTRREIIVAAMIGSPDPEINPRLRSAIYCAKKIGFPKDRIDAAIKSAIGKDKNEQYNEIRYEGYGPQGSAIILEVLTDNKNRTASELRSIFLKFGGSLGESGKLSFLFSKLTSIYVSKTMDFNRLLDLAIESGAQDVYSNDEEDHYIIYCETQDFKSCYNNIKYNIGEPDSFRIIWKPKNLISIPKDKLESFNKMMTCFEDCDDVQSIFTNVR